VTVLYIDIHSVSIITVANKSFENVTVQVLGWWNKNESPYEIRNWI